MNKFRPHIPLLGIPETEESQVFNVLLFARIPHGTISVCITPSKAIHFKVRRIQARERVTDLCLRNPLYHALANS